MPTDTTHPTDATPAAADRPVSAETGAKLLAFLGLTEGEAQLLLAARPATDAELAEALKEDIHALGLALPATTVHALVSDPKVELGTHAEGFEDRASRLRSAASLEDKLTHGVQLVHGAARLDASLASKALSDLVPQLTTRARVTPKVKETYSTILAYAHARHPGHKGGHAPAPVEPKK
jgi:hypothetical protein